MRSYTLLSALLVAGASAQTGALGDAAAITNNPIGAEYVATFPNSDKNSVRGTVTAQSAPDGHGVQFQIAISGLPETGGPWGYHLHDQPVPADGNCTGTKAHLDPYQRGQPPAAAKCDSANPQTCEVGDLSGKHGAIQGTSLSTIYVDNYASLKEGIGAFFGNRSVVIHYANSTRITCANFTQLNAGAPGMPSPSASGGFTSIVSPNATATGSPTYNPPTPPTATPPAEHTTNAAIKASFGAGAMIAAAAAFML